MYDHRTQSKLTASCFVTIYYHVSTFLTDLLQLGIGAIAEAKSGKGAITEQRINAEMFQDLSVAKENDQLIFPGLELCFNQMERERGQRVSILVFLRCFVASMAYKWRD